LFQTIQLAKSKKTFYDFQYTTELVTYAQPRKISVVNANQDGEGNQGTLKRQRTGMNEPETGSQSAPPKVSNNVVSRSHRHAAPLMMASGCKEFGKRKLFEGERSDDSLCHFNDGASRSSYVLYVVSPSALKEVHIMQMNIAVKQMTLLLIGS
jgi:hypothetical protein